MANGEKGVPFLEDDKDDPLNKFISNGGIHGVFKNSDDKPNELGRKCIITLIWIMWFIQQILMPIILLNFLIALITQQYEEVIANSEVSRYQHMSSLNSEYYITFHNNYFFPETL